MIAEEIQQIPADARTDAQWLREIAYQLAVMNENLVKKASSDYQADPNFSEVGYVPHVDHPGGPRQKRKYVRKVKIS